MAKVQGVKKASFPALRCLLRHRYAVAGDVSECDDGSTGDTVLCGHPEQDQAGNKPAGLGVLPSLNTYEARALRVIVSSQRLLETTHSLDPEQELRDVLNEAEILADLIYNSVTTLLVGEKS